MPGYEELAALIYIVNIVCIIIIFYAIATLVRTILSLKISKNVKSLELMIEKKINEGIVKPSFFEILKDWWRQRKLKKKEKKYR